VEIFEMKVGIIGAGAVGVSRREAPST
jgi:hypothetical protein